MDWNEYVQATRRGIAKLGTKVANNLAYKYEKCETREDDELWEYFYASELLRDQQLLDELCICESDQEKIVSNIHRILGPDCCKVEKDFTREANPNAAIWVLNNPLCVAYETAADYIEALCKRIKIDFKVVEQKCNAIGIDLKVTDNSVCQAIDIGLKIEKHECPSDVDVNVDLHQCIVDLQVIATKTNCDVDINTYLQLLNCGVSVDTIVSQLNCGVDIGTIVSEACETQEVDGVATEVIPDFNIVVDDTSQCYYTDFTFSLDVDLQDAIDVDWDFGSGSVPATAEGEGPHVVYYTSAGTKTITVTVGPDEVTDSQDVTVTTCLGHITGRVELADGTGIGSINVRLYNDANGDGVADDSTIVKNVFTTSGGVYTMVNLTPGNYVIVLQSLFGLWTLVSDADITEDNDEVPNTNTTNGIIPVTILPSETDTGNTFTVVAV